MSLETIIPPEIINDEFAALLTELAARQTVQSVLEVGSSDGGGSTQALLKGLLQHRSPASLFCVEMSRMRYTVLSARLKVVPDECVHAVCFCGSSVPLNGYMTPADVEDFHKHRETGFSKYPLSQVLGWLGDDISACSEASDKWVLKTLRERYKGDWYDLVLLDGSAFTGMAELQEVYGSRIIALDDICDIKHWESYHFLSQDANYQLLKENKTLRNGYAVFERV